MNLSFKASYKIGYYVDNQDNLKRIPEIVDYYFTDYKLDKNGEYYLVLSEKPLLPLQLSTTVAEPFTYVSIVAKGNLPDNSAYVFPFSGKYTPLCITPTICRNIYDIVLCNLEGEDALVYVDVLNDYKCSQLLEEYQRDTNELMFYYDDEEGTRKVETVERGLQVPYAKNISIQLKKDQTMLRELQTRIMKLKYRKVDNDSGTYNIPKKASMPEYPFLVKLGKYYDTVEQLETGDLSVYRELLSRGRSVRVVSSRWLDMLPIYAYDIYKEEFVVAEENVYRDTVIKYPYVYNVYKEDDTLMYSLVYSFLAVV